MRRKRNKIECAARARFMHFLLFFLLFLRVLRGQSSSTYAIPNALRSRAGSFAATSACALLI